MKDQIIFCHRRADRQILWYHIHGVCRFFLSVKFATSLWAKQIWIHQVNYEHLIDLMLQVRLFSPSLFFSKKLKNWNPLNIFRSKSYCFRKTFSRSNSKSSLDIIVKSGILLLHWKSNKSEAKSFLGKHWSLLLWSRFTKNVGKIQIWILFMFMLLFCIFLI